MLIGCDTMVALPGSTAHGQTLVAKNSDRTPDESQPLELHPRSEHAPGDVTRCQFVELPESPVTWRHVGSRPWWCWGYEHGFNEHQVVIGNEGLSSTLDLDRPGLIGMELIRLGLERGRTAAEAVEVITDAVTRYGQGHFKQADGTYFPNAYDNGYIVADPKEAYVIECAGHHWAVKRVEGATGISNVYSLGADWDRLSPNARPAFAHTGALRDATEKLNFAGRYGKARPSVHGQRRRARSCAVLARDEGRITLATMMGLLRDHSDVRDPAEPFQPEVGHRTGICYHAGTAGGEWQGNTAASLVADLCADGSRLPVYWCSFYSPCLGVFFPVFLEGELPPILSVGGQDPDPSSPWWLFRDLTLAAMDAPELGIPRMRDAWEAVQCRFLQSAYPAALEARRMQDNGRAEQAGRVLSEYMGECVKEVLAVARQLQRELAQGSLPR